MELSFKNKTVLITGGASGIGFETAKMFAQSGADVAITDINAELLNNSTETLKLSGYNVLAIQCDISVEQEVENAVKQTVEKFGKLNIAYNNVGIQAPVANITEACGADFDHVIAVNLKGMWNSLKYELRQMKVQGKGGAVINCSSQCGLLAQPGLGAYSASKHGVIGLTKVAALEVAKDNIRVNAICPGTTDTPMVRTAIKDYPAHMQKVIDGIPLGSIANAQEIASAVLYLASDFAGFVTGEVMALDGGCILV